MNLSSAPAVVPSIRSRLSAALVVWSLLWAATVGLGVWLAASHEVDELLDETLESSAELLAAASAPLLHALAAQAAARQAPERHGHHHAWQIVDRTGGVVWRSSLAPATAWRPQATPGFSHSGNWRVFGQPLDTDGAVLYVAQSLDERLEARLAVAMAAVVVALAASVLGHLTLRRLVARELRPLQTLSDRVATLDVRDDEGLARLGPAERQELLPLKQAIEDLARRLSARVGAERAFTAHAAHALRTPLAGIDAQLAVLAKDCPPPLRDRVMRVRGGAARLQAVVTALLGLFRTGGDLNRQPVDLHTLFARLPAAGLTVEMAEGTSTVVADEDLLSAALANLLDNAVRHGARRVRAGLSAPQHVRLDDDGPGLSAERRQALQAALEGQNDDSTVGMGLLLADRVARVHGGRLQLGASDWGGLAVTLVLTPAGRPASGDNAGSADPTRPNAA